MQTNLQSGLSVTRIIVILAAIAVLLGVLSIFTTSDGPSAATQLLENNAEMEVIEDIMVDDMGETVTDSAAQAIESEMMEDEMDMKDDDMDIGSEMMDDAPETASAPVPAASAGTFQPYSADKLALADDGTVVLFFHANWCPSCRGLENDINASLSDIPADTHILKLDYDTQTELKRKYGVVRQHTLVVVDASGNEVKKITGLTNTLEQVVNQL